MDTTSAPLADYFWIAGVDSLSYSDPVSWSQNTTIKTNSTIGPPSPGFDATIEEGDSEGDSPKNSPRKENVTPNKASARHSRQNSWNRLSKLTNDSRNSIGAFEEIDTPQSNRSSITIKGPSNGGTNGLSNSNGASGGLLGDFDFDRALMKFANEREHFLDDLSFAAGAPPKMPPVAAPPPSRTQVLKVEDAENNNTPNSRRSQLRSVGGSIRRRISFRDMNSMKRQPSSAQQRTCKFIFHVMHAVTYVPNI